MHHRSTAFWTVLPLFAAATACAQTPLAPRSSPLQVVEPNANERDLRLTPVVRAVQKAADSVVSIYLQHQLSRREAVTEGQGSGVILDESGLVITNWHVVAQLDDDVEVAGTAAPGKRRCCRRRPSAIWRCCNWRCRTTRR